MRLMLEKRLRDIKTLAEARSVGWEGEERRREGEGGGVDGDPIASRGRGSSSSVSSIRLKCYQAGLNVENVS